MIEEALWNPKKAKKARIHQSRPRRPQRGELIQVDGSPHDWFEGRGEYCNLTVFIDDATGELMKLHFSPTETTEAYMTTLYAYLKTHGRPVSLYSDKHSIFRVNHPGKEANLTQFSRALKTLDIEAIHASTPQAKGRVERVNQTLQDRFVKELRLRNISNMVDANEYCNEFIADYNRRFAVAPAIEKDAHRGLLHDDEALNQILSIQETRVLSKNLTCQYRNTEYQIKTKTKGYQLRHTKITVCRGFDGCITLLHNGKSLDYKALTKGKKSILILNEKTVGHEVDQAKLRQMSRPNYKPAPDHI